MVAKPVSNSKPRSITPENYVSCAHLAWLFELCDRRNISKHKVSSATPHQLSYLQDDSRFLTWQSFTDLVSNVAKYCDEGELRRAGRDSWSNNVLRTHGSIGRLLFNVKDQYLATFGSVGYSALNFPMKTLVTQQAGANQLSIQISMQPGFEACPAFYSVLAGQMESLPSNFDLRDATVEMSLNPNGASYIIHYPERGFLVSNAHVRPSSPTSAVSPEAAESSPITR